MKKFAFLARLEELLADLPAAERQDALNYYEEYFDAAGAEHEEEAAAALDSPEAVARSILDEAAPPPPTAKAQANPQAEPTPQPAADAPLTSPAAPEPPALPPSDSTPPDDAQPENAAADGAPNRALWAAFWAVIALAAAVQVCVLLGVRLPKLTGGSAEIASSEAAESTQRVALPSGTTYRETSTENVTLIEVGSDNSRFASTTQRISGIEINAQCADVVLQASEDGTFSASIEGEYAADYQQELKSDAGSAAVYTLTGGVYELTDSERPSSTAKVVLSLPAGTVLNSVSVRTDGGLVNLGTLTVSGEVAVECSGRICADSLTAPTVTLKSTEGSISLKQVQSKALTLDAPAGQIKAEIRGSKEDYVIAASSAGQMNRRVWIDNSSYGSTVSIVGEAASGTLTANAGAACILTFEE